MSDHVRVSYFTRGLCIHIYTRAETELLEATSVFDKDSSEIAQTDAKLQSRAWKCPAWQSCFEEKRIRKKTHLNQRAQIYNMVATHEMADKIVLSMGDMLSGNRHEFVASVVYPAGPNTFTATRILMAVGKGISITNPATRFVGVSNFLTYLSIIPEKSDRGLITMPAKRGDFFTCEYLGRTLQDQRILSTRDIDKYRYDIFHEEDSIFDDVNLADQQDFVLSSVLATQNASHIQIGLQVNYAFLPEYTQKAPAGI
ncbi:MAG: hypothetical protein LBF56_00615 [Holosporales bacterium]|jgi:tRNA A37 threonylcarbamoyladenosine modification protein TsaB|nr:hypothetical protein [Holosporales bacterium]